MKEKLSNKIIMRLLRLLSFFSFQDGDLEKVLAHAKAHNEKQKFKLPRNRKIEFKDLKSLQTTCPSASII